MTELEERLTALLQVWCVVLEGLKGGEGLHPIVDGVLEDMVAVRDELWDMYEKGD